MLMVVIFTGETLAPSCEQDDGRRRRYGLHRGSNAAAIHIRHTQICNHKFNVLLGIERLFERTDAELSAERIENNVAPGATCTRTS